MDSTYFVFKATKFVDWWAGHIQGSIDYFVSGDRMERSSVGSDGGGASNYVEQLVILGGQVRALCIINYIL
jgi:hypothetical protein